MLPVLNPKSYDGARVLEASGRPMGWECIVLYLQPVLNPKSYDGMGWEGQRQGVDQRGGRHCPQRRHRKYFAGIKMRGNFDSEFFDNINEVFVCLVGTAIRHCLKSWETGEYVGGIGDVATARLPALPGGWQKLKKKRKSLYPG